MLVVCGAHGSPFVRKTCLFLAEKKQPYDIEQVIPVKVSPEYRKISPLGKIPCLKDGDFTIPDSSVICQYLEKKFPNPSLYPSDPQTFARALWFEEYADTALIAVLGGKILFPKVLAPILLQKPVDEAAVQSAIEKDVPPLFEYLESQLREDKPVVGESQSIADIALLAHLLTFNLAGFQIDATRWPKLEAFVKRGLAKESVKNYFDAERRTFGLA